MNSLFAYLFQYIKSGMEQDYNLYLEGTWVCILYWCEEICVYTCLYCMHVWYAYACFFVNMYGYICVCFSVFKIGNQGM